METHRENRSWRASARWEDAIISSTHRGGDRHASDYYRTPRWCIRRLLESGYLAEHGADGSERTLRMLDPMAGNGRFIEVFNERHAVGAFDWTAVEIRTEEVTALLSLTPTENVHMCEFLTWARHADEPRAGYDLCITNPAFSIAFEALRAALTFCRRVTFLQRRNWLGSEERADFFRTHMPDEAVLPNRPCFTLNEHGKPATDSIEYSFFTFHGADSPGEPIPLRPWGKTTILGSTSKEERRVEIDELIAEGRRLPSKDQTP